MVNMSEMTVSSQAQQRWVQSVVAMPEEVRLLRNFCC